MTGDFSNKVVWVTGASAGIGAEIAVQLSKLGAKLILSARNADRLEEVYSALHGEGHMVLPMDLEFSHDFGDKAKVVMEHFGRIDLVVNNGGLSQRSKVSETSLEIDRRIMEINYFGNIALSKAVLPYMKAQRSGHFVVISSISGKFGFFLRSAYSASKHALHGFYESLLLEEERNGIGVTIVCPGKINTNISLNALNEKGESHGIMDHNQATGMSVEACVSQLLKAVSANKKEIYIGNKEILAVQIKRYFPALFWKIIRKQSAT